MPPSKRPRLSASSAAAFQAEQLERADGGLYLALLELIDEGVLITGDETIFEVNSAACSLLGRDYRDLAGRPFATVFADEPAFLQARERLLIHGESRGELEVTQSDGSVKTLEFTAAARVRPGLHALIVRPPQATSRRKRGPQSTRPSEPTNTTEALWLHLATAMDQATLVLDPKLRIAALNPAAIALFKRSHADLIHLPVADILDWPAQEAQSLAHAGQAFRVRLKHGTALNAQVLTGPKPGWLLLVLSPISARSAQPLDALTASTTSPPPLEHAAMVHAALSSTELEVVFQPLVDSHSRQINAGEALLRWHHPKRGLLDFEQIRHWIEAPELLALLSDWGLQQACRLASQWPQSQRGLTVNISTAQALRGDFVARVNHALHSYGWPAARLGLDFEESLLLADEQHISAILQPLAEAGVKLAIDGFGRHPVSLLTLARLPLYALKLDPSLIAKVGHDERSEALVEAVSAFARVLGFKVLARGVTSPAQHAFLTALGCDVQQGPLFGPPLTAGAFETLPDRT